MINLLLRKKMDVIRGLFTPRPPLAEQFAGEKLYNRKEAAAFLLVAPRTVTRYRAEGKLAFVRSRKGQIYYREADLRECYFRKWGRQP